MNRAYVSFDSGLGTVEIFEEHLEWWDACDRETRAVYQELKRGGIVKPTTSVSELGVLIRGIKQGGIRK